MIWRWYHRYVGIFKLRLTEWGINVFIIVCNLNFLLSIIIAKKTKQQNKGPGRKGKTEQNEGT